MLNRRLKIFIFFYVIVYFPCFSQTKPAIISKDDVLSQFNAYLKAVHLNQIVVATDYSFKKEIVHEGGSGKITLNNVDVLTIEPTTALENTLTFASTWKQVVRSLNGKTPIYWQQFFKLADITQLAPKSLVIVLRTKQPKLYSYMVYFDNAIMVSESPTEIKGSAGIAIEMDPNEDFPFDGFFEGDNAEGLTAKLIVRLTHFLKSAKNGKENPSVDVKVENHYLKNSYFRFTAVNLKGKITSKFYEMVRLHISVFPMDNAKKVAIGYNFNVSFGSESYKTAASLKNYEDARKNYFVEMIKFNEDLKKIIYNVLHEQAKR